MSICNNSPSACAQEVGIGNPHGFVFTVPLPGPMRLGWVILSGLCLRSSCLGPGAWDSNAVWFLSTELLPGCGDERKKKLANL